MNNLKFLSITAVSTVLIFLSGCKKDQLPTQNFKTPTSQKPVNKGNPIVLPTEPDSNPESADPIIPSPVQGPEIPAGGADPSGPSIPGSIRRVSWAALDFKEFEYNAAGSIIKFTRQYNYIQGSKAVKRDEYTYSYDQSGRLLAVKSKDGIHTDYAYQDDVWSHALSFDKLGRPLRKYQFQFNSNEQLVELLEFDAAPNGTLTSKLKIAFSYDSRGNLTRYTTFSYSESSQTFVKSTDLRFSNFDSKRYGKNGDTFNYILQPLNFFVNNPGKKEFIGSASPVESYSYTYDAEGYPTRKVTAYNYDKPLPSLEAIIEY